jgi:hypothetical protein
MSKLMDDLLTALFDNIDEVMQRDVRIRNGYISLCEDVLQFLDGHYIKRDDYKPKGEEEVARSIGMVTALGTIHINVEAMIEALKEE